ncbi:MAG: universal stress protein [Firmicutes bacterium]|nr:universal stress protein [Bacillota bacterium]
MIKKILVPVDGSPPSIRAAQMAANIVAKEGGEIHLLNVVKPSSGDYSGVSFEGFELPQDLAEKVNDEWEKVARNIVNKVRSAIEDKNVNIHCDIAKGDPVSIICKVAQEGQFSLISIGSRGIGGVTGVLGSISSRVSQQSSCPVLINH